MHEKFENQSMWNGIFQSFNKTLGKVEHAVIFVVEAVFLIAPQIALAAKTNAIHMSLAKWAICSAVKKHNLNIFFDLKVDARTSMSHNQCLTGSLQKSHYPAGNHHTSHF